MSESFNPYSSDASNGLSNQSNIVPSESNGVPSQYGTPNQNMNAFNSGWKTVIPMRPLGIMDTLEATIRLLKFNPKALILFPFIVTLIASIIASIALGFFDESSFASDSIDSMYLSTGFSGVGVIVYAVVEFLATVLTTIVCARVVVASVRGKKMDLSDAVSVAKPNFWRILLRLLVLYLLLVVIAVIYAALIIAAILLAFGEAPFEALNSLFTDPNTEIDEAGVLIAFFAVILIVSVLTAAIALALYARFLLAPTALVVENLGPMKSLARSWRLTKGSFWHMVGLLLLAGLLTSAIIGAFSMIAGLLIGLIMLAGGDDQSTLLNIISILISTIITSAVVVPFMMTLENMMYVNMRFRRENLHLQIINEYAE